jgi:hypothetical protein
MFQSQMYNRMQTPLMNLPYNQHQQHNLNNVSKKILWHIFYIHFNFKVQFQMSNLTINQNTANNWPNSQSFPTPNRPTTANNNINNFNFDFNLNSASTNNNNNTNSTNTTMSSNLWQ